MSGTFISLLILEPLALGLRFSIPSSKRRGGCRKTPSPLRAHHPDPGPTCALDKKKVSGTFILDGGPARS